MAHEDIVKIEKLIDEGKTAELVPIVVRSLKDDKVIVEGGSIDFIEKLFVYLSEKKCGFEVDVTKDVVHSSWEKMLDALWKRMVEAIDQGHPTFLQAMCKVIPNFADPERSCPESQTGVHSERKPRKVWEHIALEGRADWLWDFVYVNNSIELGEASDGRSLFEIVTRDATVDVGMAVLKYCKEHTQGLGFNKDAKLTFQIGIERAILKGRIDYLKMAYSLTMVEEPHGFMMEAGEEKKSLLVTAVACDEVEEDRRKEIIDFLLEQGADLNEAESNELNPLGVAIFTNQEMARYLLIEKGADVGVVLQHERTILHSLVESDKVDVAFFEEIIEACPIIKTLISQKDDCGSVPLALAILFKRFDFIPALLEMGEESINEQDMEGYTPLMLAAIEGSKEVMGLLLEVKDVDVHLVDSRGHSVLHIAATEESLDCLELLLERDDVLEDLEVSDLNGRTPLRGAVRQKRVDHVESLLEKGASVDEGTMQEAIASENIDVMALLLSYGYEWHSFLRLNQDFGKPEYCNQVKQSVYYDEEEQVGQIRPVRAADLNNNNNNNNVMGWEEPEEENRRNQNMPRNFGL